MTEVVHTEKADCPLDSGTAEALRIPSHATVNKDYLLSDGVIH